MLDPDFQDPIRYAPRHDWPVLAIYGTPMTPHGLDPTPRWANYQERMKPLEPERYFMDVGYDANFYIIHVDNRDKWNTFLADWQGGEPTPTWAVRVTKGFFNVTFERPEGA